MITAADKTLYFFVFVVLLVIGVLLYRWAGNRAVQRWDQLPDLVPCPDCECGVVRKRDGQTIPVPRHKIFSDGRGRDCPTCLGRGFVAKPGWKPSEENSLVVDDPPMPRNQADDGETDLL
jgi:hypothetical protein